MKRTEYSRDPGVAKLMSSLVADFTPETPEDAYIGVDNPPTRPNDRRMTDLTRQEIDAKLAANKAEVDARLANFDTSVKTGFAELRAEFADLRTEMANGRTEAAKQNHESIKWIVGSVFGMLSLSVAIIGAFINFSRAEKASPGPAAQTAPIVITVPAPAPLQAPPPTK